MNFTIKLTEQELNVISNALVERPFKEVVQVMETLRKQVIETQQEAKEKEVQ